MATACTVGSCLAPARAKGLCKKHEHQVRRHGRAHTAWTKEQRFWQKVNRSTPEACWPWSGHIGPQGYGVVKIDGAAQGAHQAAYRYARGPIPQGLELDHRCHDPRVCAGGPSCPHRRCCNPAHLKPVTNEENSSPERSSRQLLAARQRAVETCPAGHEYTPENTHVDRRGWRNCRKCRRISQANGRKKKSAAGAGQEFDWLTHEPGVEFE